MKNCLGIEIGHYRVKIAYMEHGELQTYVSERLETENQTDMKVYAELIKDVLKENNIRCKNAVFVLRQDDTYVKRCSVPLMTVDQLKLNLPFEFHDYIGDELEQYQFDYGVIERTEDQPDRCLLQKRPVSAVFETCKNGKIKADWSGPRCDRSGTYPGAYERG